MAVAEVNIARTLFVSRASQALIRVEDLCHPARLALVAKSLMQPQHHAGVARAAHILLEECARRCLVGPDKLSVAQHALIALRAPSPVGVRQPHARLARPVLPPYQGQAHVRLARPAPTLLVLGQGLAPLAGAVTSPPH